MSIQWECVKSEKDLKTFSGVNISVEKIGSDITSVVLSDKDNNKLKICKKGEYTTSLHILVPADNQRVVTKYTVVAKKDGDCMECTRDTLDAAENKKYDLEQDGWVVEIVEIEEVVKTDIISGKKIDNIPF